MVAIQWYIKDCKRMVLNNAHLLMYEKKLLTNNCNTVAIAMIEIIGCIILTYSSYVTVCVLAMDLH